MSKKILVNVYNNDGIVEFAKNLSEKNDYDIFATEKTYEYLSANGLCVEKIDWQNTDFDVVVCNFYPLEKYLNKDMDEEEVLAHFDSEGLSIVQKFAKKYKDTIVLINPSQYETVFEAIKNGTVTENLKKELAEKALMQVCKLNATLLNILDTNGVHLNLNEEKSGDLAYGENQHQKAALYTGDTISYEVIANRQLSTNNILDINLATQMVSEFYDVNAAVVTRHAMPCAVALGSTLEIAYQKAIDCDPISAFGGVVAFSQKVDTKLAKALSSLLLDIVIAPDFDDDAIETLKECNLKLIKIFTPLKDFKAYLKNQITITPFGTLVQEPNTAELNTNSFKVVTKKKPTTEQVEDMVFGWKVSKYTRSNSAIVVKDLKTVGISQGQANRVEAVDIALDKACENSKDAVLVTDGAIRTKDIILDAAQARIAAILQPAGTKKDKEIFDVADKYELTMVRTLLREFKH